MNESVLFTCEETFRRMKDYVDRELIAGDVLLVERHLKSCGACASEYRFEQSLLREARAKLRSIPTPSDAVERILAGAGSENEPASC